jgi:hypothetical protein
MNGADSLRPALERWQRRALVVGVAGLALTAGGGWMARAQFFQSYLLGFLFWAGLTLGCFALLLLHQTFGAGWGFVMQRTLEAGTRVFPLLAVLFVPLLFGLHDLYEWTHAEVVAGNEALTHKSAYLNVEFFIGRAVFYFLAWVGVAYLLNKWSRELDASGDPRLADRLRNAGPPGLLVYGLTATFAGVDWVMSLEPHWFSTMFGLMLIAGQVLSTLAFVVIVVGRLAAHPPLVKVARPQHFHDLGNLMLAFTMIWAYLSFSQFLIIWSGNLPETITWYQHRSAGGWQWLALGLFVFSFALPFVLLLSRRSKRRAETLAVVGGLALAMRLVDLFWLVAPTFRPALAVHWMDVTAPVGLGGLWLAYFFYQLKGRPTLPALDPRLKEAFADEGH